MLGTHEETRQRVVLCRYLLIVELRGNPKGWLRDTWKKESPEDRSEAWPSRVVVTQGGAREGLGFGHAGCEVSSKTRGESYEVRSWAERVGRGRQAPAGDVNLKLLPYRRHLKP